MLKPKDIKVIDMDGVERSFTIGRYPATDGMEILYKLPMSAIPKIGDFDKLKEVRNEIFKFIAVKTENGDLILSNKALIDNHTNDAETAYKLMKESIEYNYSFFNNGMISGFLDSLTKKIPNTASKILTLFSESLSKKTKQR